jgi:hypothetical protein
LFIHRGEATPAVDWSALIADRPSLIRWNTRLIHLAWNGGGPFKRLGLIGERVSSVVLDDDDSTVQTDVGRLDPLAFLGGSESVSDGAPIAGTGDFRLESLTDAIGSIRVDDRGVYRLIRPADVVEVCRRRVVHERSRRTAPKSVERAPT